MFHHILWALLAMDGNAGPLQFTAITALQFPHLSNSDSLIARTVLEPAPGYFLQLMPFSENSLVEDLPSGGEGNRTSLVSGPLG
jgi:hypothetical protein